MTQSRLKVNQSNIRRILCEKLLIFVMNQYAIADFFWLISAVVRANVTLLSYLLVTFAAILTTEDGQLDEQGIASKCTTTG